MSQLRYICQELPHDRASVTKWVDKFVHLRLKGLQSDPDNFTSTYATESSRSIEEWVTILSKPAFSVVVCTLSSSEKNTTDVWERDWIGQLLNYGPKLRNLKDSSNDKDQSTETVRFLSGVYVLPEHRKNNITTMLVDYAVEIHSEKPTPLSSSSHRAAVFQGIVSPRQKRLVRYYRTLRMIPTGIMSRREFCGSWGIPVEENVVDESIIVMERRGRLYADPTASSRL